MYGYWKCDLPFLFWTESFHNALHLITSDADVVIKETPLFCVVLIVKMRMQLLMGTILSNIGDEFDGVGFGVDEIPNENEVNKTRYDTIFCIIRCGR